MCKDHNDKDADRLDAYDLEAPSSKAFFEPIVLMSVCPMSTPASPMTARDCDILSSDSSPLKMSHKLMRYTMPTTSVLSLRRLLVPILPSGEEPEVVEVEAEKIID